MNPLLASTGRESPLVELVTIITTYEARSYMAPCVYLLSFQHHHGLHVLVASCAYKYSCTSTDYMYLLAALAAIPCFFFLCGIISLARTDEADMQKRVGSVLWGATGRLAAANLSPLSVRIPLVPP